MNEAASSGFRIHTYRNDREWVGSFHGLRVPWLRHRRNFGTLDRTAEVFSHHSSLTLQMCHTTQSCCLILRRRPVLELWQNSLDYLERSETDKLPGRSDLSWFVTWSQASETSQIVIYWFDWSFTVEHLGNPVDVCFRRLALPVTRQLIHRLIHNFCGNVFGLGVLLNGSRSLGDW